MPDILGMVYSVKCLTALGGDCLTVKKPLYNSMKPGTPVLRSIRLLNQVRKRIAYLHYSLNTEKAYLYWVRFFNR